MTETRQTLRHLCADLLKVRWKDDSGIQRKEFAVLDDISTGGACLKIDQPIAQGNDVKILYPGGHYRGTVKYCVRDVTGYLVGVKFALGYRWSRNEYDPAHLMPL